MSFGEHLEELRSALWKAVVAIFIGFLIGLLVGQHFIRFVEAPLEAGLTELEQSRKNNAFAEAEGEASASEQQLQEDGLVPDAIYLDTERLIESLRSVGVGVSPPEELPDRVQLWLWAEPDDAQVITTEIQAGFSVYIRASLVVGLVLASPAVFYFLWSFVAVGLYPHEKRYVHLFLPVSIGLFLFGAVVAFYIVLQYVIGFLLDFNEWLGIEATPRINEWLSFVVILPVMFGVAFQLPLVMLFLERIGVASLKTYTSYWRYAVLVIFVISMILTPAEPWSLVAMAGFLTPLYFGGILLCKYLPRSRPPDETPLAAT